jgi:hypothetical protein
MTPKEKAEELVSKFNFEHIGQTYILHQTVDESKRCALIAVDEVIQQWEVIDTYIADFGGQLNQSLKFWQEVKKEIQAL